MSQYSNIKTNYKNHDILRSHDILQLTFVCPNGKFYSLLQNVVETSNIFLS